MKRVGLAILLSVCTSYQVSAWWASGHGTITLAAVKATPEVPEFFKQGAGFISHMAFDPDVVKNNDASIVIASVNYYGEIANQIIAMGVSAKRIVPNIIL